MSTQKGGLVHTECGGGGRGVERDEGGLWLESAFGRRIAFFVREDRQRTAAKGLARLLRLLSKVPFHQDF